MATAKVYPFQKRPPEEKSLGWRVGLAAWMAFCVTCAVVNVPCAAIDEGLRRWRAWEGRAPRARSPED